MILEFFNNIPGVTFIGITFWHTNTIQHFSTEQNDVSKSWFKEYLSLIKKKHRTMQLFRSYDILPKH